MSRETVQADARRWAEEQQARHHAALAARLRCQRTLSDVLNKPVRNRGDIAFSISTYLTAVHVPDGYREHVMALGDGEKHDVLRRLLHKIAGELPSGTALAQQLDHLLFAELVTLAAIMAPAVNVILGSGAVLADNITTWLMTVPDPEAGP